MSAAVEAKSLSTLTTLASNPPSYPRNPTHVRHDPLVLYIARVPGSRDVFLSPMKPRSRVVTAEDVQSSLYYLHVDQPEDARLITPPPPAAEYEEEVPSQPPPPPLHRKAIPPTLPPYPLDAAMPDSLVPGHPGPLAAPAPRRKPVPGLLTPRAGIENQFNMGAPNVLHGSLPSNADYGQRLSLDSNQYRPGNEAPGLYPRRQSEQPKLPPRPNFNGAPASYHGRASSHDSHGAAFGDSNGSRLEPPNHSAQSARRSLDQRYDRPFGGTSLTLIRRDPGSGAQWNVAKMEDPPILEVSSSTLNDPSTGSRKQAGAPLFIEISNPGYSKFLHNNEQQSKVPDEAPPRVSQPDSRTSVFRRRLWMEGSKYGGSGFGHRRLQSQDSGFGRNSLGDSSEGRPSVTLEPPSAHPFARDDQAYGTTQVSNKSASFRGYVFLSPWNGRCEFVTGGGGGSLKCRHVITGLQGTPTLMPVSELRFNLPSSSKASTPRDESKRSSFFHRPRNSRNNSSMSNIRDDSAEDVSTSLNRLDLSLGQEFAGGGFGGRQAKLGKLIIEDEGLKMVDLLVAANLALWWRAYEKV